METRTEVILSVVTVTAMTPLSTDVPHAATSSVRFVLLGINGHASTKTHRLLSLEEAKEEGPIAVVRPAFCKEHEGEMLKLFCETCDEAICRDCTSWSNRETTNTLLSRLLFQRNRLCKKVITCFQELTTHLNTRCEELIHDIEEFKMSKLKSLEIQQGELETALGSVGKQCKNFTERALENGSEVEIFEHVQANVQ
ncbi:Tripartite motif-containing protein 45 [Desmophyllum pertusum]|uniref:Tripartite motif-containing protein 45 n=1 Tax=Desmophyllum pertusum TaxID=174260 RepID=A0A9X0A3F2_9CNID|nr:Tripartite motif-containing protein 45 [Desmophyllum pertusum]